MPTLIKINNTDCVQLIKNLCTEQSDVQLELFSRGFTFDFDRNIFIKMDITNCPVSDTMIYVIGSKFIDVKSYSDSVASIGFRTCYGIDNCIIGDDEIEMFCSSFILDSSLSNTNFMH